MGRIAVPAADLRLRYEHTGNPADIRAWSLATDTGCAFGEAPGTPRATLLVAIASGDKDPPAREMQDHEKAREIRRQSRTRQFGPGDDEAWKIARYSFATTNPLPR